jgi:GTP:adenosylcobinamide-phosphate guanylyltransferase
MKITLKNKLRGGAQTLPYGKGTSLNATSFPPLNDPPELNAEMLPYTPSIKEILDSKPELNELLKTYDNRQKFNLINISFSTITSFLNIFVIYLDDITDIEEAQKSQLIEQLKKLLTNINNFKYRYNYNLINTETPIDTTAINQNIIEINRLLELIETTEIGYNNNMNNLIRQINTIDNKSILYIITQLFVIDNNIFNYLITDYTTINKILTKKDKDEIIMHNRQILMSIQALSNYFISKSTTLQNKLTSQNTYNSTIKIHKLLYTFLEASVSNNGSELGNLENIYNQVP